MPLEDLETEFYNIVIDYPARELPRIRVYVVSTDPQDGMVTNYGLVEFPPPENCQLAGSFVSRYGHYPTLPPGIEPQKICTMVSGISNVESVVLHWSAEYEKNVGQPLFPSPLQISQHITAQIMEVYMLGNGYFYYGREQVNSIIAQSTQPAEDYRPGIYL